MEHPTDPIDEFSRDKWAYIMEAFAMAMESMPHETEADNEDVQFVQSAYHLLQNTMRARDYK